MIFATYQFERASGCQPQRDFSSIVRISLNSSHYNMTRRLIASSYAFVATCIWSADNEKKPHYLPFVSIFKGSETHLDGHGCLVVDAWTFSKFSSHLVSMLRDGKPTLPDNQTSKKLREAWERRKGK